MERLRTFFEKNYKKIFVVLACIAAVAAAFMLQPSERTAAPAPAITAEVKENVDGAYHKSGGQENAPTESPAVTGVKETKNAQKSGDSKTVVQTEDAADDGSRDEPAAGNTAADSAEDSKRASDECVVSISCATVLNNMDKLKKSKRDIIPAGGIILKRTKAEFQDGDSAFDVLERTLRAEKIHLEFSKTPAYNSVYIEGIANLYEFDCGELSGWQYRVNGVFPSYASSEYKLKDGDVVEFLYTCDMGGDIGNSFSN